MSWGETEKRELLENLRWFQGAEDRLEYFFKNEYNTFKKGVHEQFNVIEKQQKFWRSVGGDIPRVHSGLPKLITKTKVNLITGNGIEIDGDEKDVARLWEILNATDFIKNWQNAETTASWSGRGLLRLYHNENDHQPRIEYVNPESFEIHKSRGEIIGVTYISKDDDIEIHENITKNLNGTWGVNYDAFKVENVGGVVEKTPIAVDDLNDFVTEFPFQPFVLLNNSNTNSKFLESPYGESDYTGVQSLFHALDGALSHQQLELEKARAIMFYNEQILKKDSSGHAVFNKNETNIEMSNLDMENFDVNKQIELVQPLIRTEQYKKTIEDYTGRILAAVGISAVSVGLAGYERVDAAAESQREREKASLRTRNNVLDIRRDDFTPFFNTVLKYDDWLKSVRLGDYLFTVGFSEWGVPTFDEKVKTIGDAIEKGVIDTYTAVYEMFKDDKTDDEIGQIVFRTKIERGIPLLRDDYERAGIDVPQVPQAAEVDETEQVE